MLIALRRLAREDPSADRLVRPRWTIHPGPAGQGVAEGVPPTLKGDGITIGKDGASSALVYWDGAAWTSYWQGD